MGIGGLFDQFVEGRAFFGGGLAGEAAGVEVVDDLVGREVFGQFFLDQAALRARADGFFLLAPAAAA